MKALKCTVERTQNSNNVSQLNTALYNLLNPRMKATHDTEKNTALFNNVQVASKDCLYLGICGVFKRRLF